jgi:oxygen-independent coproporphyrinogen-3 oxidase
MQGLYVHIPFCVKKCGYCDFYSLPSRLDSIEAYVQAIIKEAIFYRNDILSPVAAEMNVAHGDSSGTAYLHKDNNLFQTLYIGGGTPSLLGAKYLKILIDGLENTLNLRINNTNRHCEESRLYQDDATISGGKIPISPGLLRSTRNDALGLVETTIEVNPESATSGFLKAAQDCGINRVSFGVQSLSDDELKSVGRIHTAAQAIEAIKLAGKIDFKSISADLIIGLPGQTWFTLQRSLEKLISLGIEHLSVYCLSLEEGTPLAKSPPDNLPSDDMQAKLYEDTRSFLAAAGFIHYEISNFALKGCECQHNLNYWRGGEYVGLGTAAASHLNGKRFRNKANLDAYLENPTGQIEYDEILSLKDKAAEEAMLRLRLVNEGLDIVELSKKYGDKNVAKLRKRLDSMAHEGSLISEGSRYRLASSRILTSNQIFARVLKE